MTQLERNEQEANHDELPKELELAVLHTVNTQMYKIGAISVDLYERAKAEIDRLYKL